MILDATCSFRTKTRWPRFASIRIDIRAETRPDFVMDARTLKFPNAYFTEIYCDPPHLITKKVSPWLEQYRRLHGRIGKMTMFTHYGYWHSREEWLDFAEKSCREFYRCLKSNGLLHYKLTESKDMSPQDILRLGLFIIIKHRITNSKSRMPSRCKVHWLTMKPKPRDV